MGEAKVLSLHGDPHDDGAQAIMRGALDGWHSANPRLSVFLYLRTVAPGGQQDSCLKTFMLETCCQVIEQWQASARNLIERELQMEARRPKQPEQSRSHTCA